MDALGDQAHQVRINHYRRALRGNRSPNALQNHRPPADLQHLRSDAWQLTVRVRPPGLTTPYRSGPPPRRFRWD